MSHFFQDLVDIDIFREAKRVIDALKRREVANKTRLKKSKSIIIAESLTIGPKTFYFYFYPI